MHDSLRKLLYLLSLDLFCCSPCITCAVWLQRHDEAGQHNGTPMWAEDDEPMEFSQPVFGDYKPSQHDQRRVSHTAASMCSATENDRPLPLFLPSLSAEGSLLLPWARPSKMLLTMVLSYIATKGCMKHSMQRS